MRVLFVNTNCMKPVIAPIGLDYLADVLEEARHEVQLLDLCFAEDIDREIAHRVPPFAPEVIGVTARNTDDCYFSGQSFFLPEIKQTIKKLREVSDVPVVLGGGGYSVMPNAAFDFCEADYGIAGEGERAFPRL